MSNKNTERKWDREEVVILVVEYFRTKNLSSDEISKIHQEISDFLRRREEILTGVPVSDIFRNYAGNKASKRNSARVSDGSGSTYC